MKKKKDSKSVLFQAPNGAIALRGDFRKETIWATLDQIATVFERDKSVISRHFRNIFNEGELKRSSVVAKYATTAVDGKVYQVEYYNLDAVISVGYRVNSKVATEFRKWATKILRAHITKGFTINRRQVTRNYEAFMKSVSDIQALLPKHTTLDPKAMLDLVKEFSSTWVSLVAYDKDALTTIGTTKKKLALSGHELTDALAKFRLALIQNGNATDIFAQERTAGSIAGIIGNVRQSFGGKPVYASVEEQAAHLLYFMVKNHPFIDGNKRSGAFAFVWFLRRAKARKFRNISPPTLTALTILIAESNPKKKEQMTALVTQLLK